MAIYNSSEIRIPSHVFNNTAYRNSEISNTLAVPSIEAETRKSRLAEAERD